MHFAKRLGLVLLATVFRLSVIGVIVLAPIVMVFGTADQLKTSLAQSKIYDNAVQSIIDNAAKDSFERGDTESPFTRPIVQDAAKKTLTPEFLKTTSEGILDGMYGWLHKETNRPEFNIDVSAVKQQFIDAAGDGAVERARPLPTCTPQQTRQLAGQVDPLNSECLPPGFDIESLRAKIAAQIETPSGGEGNLLQQSTISPDSLPRDEDGKTVVDNMTQDARQAPEIFGWITRAPWLFALLAIITGGLYIWLNEDRRRGLRRLAITLLVLGLLTLVGILLTNMIFERLQQSDALVNADMHLKQPVTDLVTSLRSAFNQKLGLLGGLYVVLGAGTLAGLYFTKPKAHTRINESELHESSETPEKEQEKSLNEMTKDTSEKKQKGSPS